MSERCVICKETIVEEHGKLRGTIVKVLGTSGKNEFLYVCKDCQKKDTWIEKAKVKGA